MAAAPGPSAQEQEQAKALAEAAAAAAEAEALRKALDEETERLRRREAEAEERRAEAEERRARKEAEAEAEARAEEERILALVAEVKGVDEAQAMIKFVEGQGAAIHHHVLLAVLERMGDGMEGGEWSNQSSGFSYELRPFSAEAQDEAMEISKTAPFWAWATAVQPQIMEKVKTDAKFAEAITKAVHWLSRHRPNVEKLSASDFLPTVFSALWAHPANALVAWHGCGALHNFTFGLEPVNIASREKLRAWGTEKLMSAIQKRAGYEVGAEGGRGFQAGVPHRVAEMARDMATKVVNDLKTLK